MVDDDAAMQAAGGSEADCRKAPDAPRRAVASRVANELRIKNPLIKAIRELLEHRALWLYLLTDEAKRAGADPSVFAPAAVKRCGLFQGGELVAKGGGTHSLKSLKKELSANLRRWCSRWTSKTCRTIASSWSFIIARS